LLLIPVLVLVLSVDLTLLDSVEHQQHDVQPEEDARCHSDAETPVTDQEGC